MDFLAGAPEGIRTPNLLIRSFYGRLSERISKVLVLRSFVSFVSFERKSVLFVSAYVLRYLYR
jgi:hypothetical protein